MMMREVITIKHWVDGSGYSYEETYINRVEPAEDYFLRDQYDWGWWLEHNNYDITPKDGEDLLIIAEYYLVEDEDDDYEGTEPLKSYSIWESEIINAYLKGSEQ